MPDFLQAVKERVVVYDGAMGTNIQKRNPTLDDYWGKENCSEVLVLSRPDIIRDIHADFFRVGCDIVETNTFGGSSIVLGEFDLRDKVREINLKAAQLAREVADQFSTKDKPRFVAGSLGPTTKLPSLGHIGFEAMVEAFEEHGLYQAAFALTIWIDELFDQKASLQNEPAAIKLATHSALASAKLAAALSGDDVDEIGMTIAYLKRALKAITISMNAAARLLSEKLLDGTQHSVLQQRLFQVRDGIITLMGEYRAEWRRRFGSEGYCR